MARMVFLDFDHLYVSRSYSFWPHETDSRELNLEGLLEGQYLLLQEVKVFLTQILLISCML